MLCKKAVVYLLLTCLSFSCKPKKDDETTPANNTETHQREVLKNIGENLIVKSYYNFNAASTSLKNSCATFTNDPTLQNLNALQTEWINTKLAWKRCEVFSFGPAETLLIGSSIDYTLINTITIENNIATAATIDNAYINTKSSTSKGLTALEYLLFDHSNNTAILNHFNSDSDFEKRKLYLYALCENLEEQAAIIYREWDPEQKNYLKKFKSNTGLQTSGSLSLLVNAVIKSCDILKTTKLGTPIGKNTGTASPSSVEAYYSSYSISCIQETITCYQNIITGTGFEDMDGKGINMLLKDEVYKINTYNSIVTNIEENIANCESFNTSLEDAILNSSAEPETLYNSSNELLILLKNELSSVLGVLVTFTDSDGD